MGFLSDAAGFFSNFKCKFNQEGIIGLSSVCSHLFIYFIYWGQAFTKRCPKTSGKLQSCFMARLAGSAHLPLAIMGS